VFFAIMTRICTSTLYTGGRVVVIGSSGQVFTEDISSHIGAEDTIVRINLNVVEGHVWLPDFVRNHTTARTDVVCHHSMLATHKSIVHSNLRPEVAFSAANLDAYRRHGIKELVCFGHSCDHMVNMSTKSLHIRGPSPKTLLWRRKKHLTTGMQCIYDMLQNVKQVFVFGVDFHEGGCRKSFYPGYNEFHAPVGYNVSQISLVQQASKWHNFAREMKLFKKMYHTVHPRILITQTLKNMMFHMKTC